jgi:hypothetical protein
VLQDLDAIADALRDALAGAEAELAEEQAVHGLEAWGELGLHALLAKGLAAAPFAVFREHPFPGQPEHIPDERDRLRCDLVVAPAGTTSLVDPVRTAREARRASETLFADVASRPAAPARGALGAEDALWLEVKVLAQYAYIEGVAGPNRAYAGQVAACLRDVAKLGRADRIEHAALAVVAFHDGAETARHDLAALAHRALDRDLPVGGLITRQTPIADRIGNRVCTLGLLRVRPGPRS